MKVNNIVDKYLGTPYLDNGRDPTIGLDCLGLIICVTKDLFNVDFPDLHYRKFGALKNYVKSGKPKQSGCIEENKDIINEYDLSTWVHPVEDKKLGDFILLCPIKDLAIHIGIYLFRDTFIHSILNGGVVLGDVTDHKKQIEGFYRINTDRLAKAY